MKKIIAAGIILLVLGLVVGVVSFALAGFRFDGFKTVEYETKTTELRGDFHNIHIIGDTAHIAIHHPMYPTLDNSAKLESVESENRRTVVTVEDDTLTIRLVDERKWYERMEISLQSPMLDLYLPEGDYGDLTIENSTGSIHIPGNFDFDSVRITCSTGDVTFQSSAETIAVKTSTGDIHLSNLNAKEITLNVTTGRVQLYKVTCGVLSTEGDTGKVFFEDVAAEQSLNIRRSTGDVKLTNCDAGRITIRTGTGDVKGTLRTGKVFQTKTDTGRVEVPYNYPGGTICEIETDTGDIKIEVG